MSGHVAKCSQRVGGSKNANKVDSQTNDWSAIEFAGNDGVEEGCIYVFEISGENKGGLGWRSTVVKVNSNEIVTRGEGG